MGWFQALVSFPNTSRLKFIENQQSITIVFKEMKFAGKETASVTKEMASAIKEMNAVSQEIDKDYAAMASNLSAWKSVC